MVLATWQALGFGPPEGLPAEVPMSARRGSQAGFTLTEMMVVAGIVGVLVALAVPRFRVTQSNQRVRAASRAVGDAFLLARELAIQTRNVQVVYFGTTATTDACGNPLEDAGGNLVPLLILDDGPPSAGPNCCIDPGETTVTEPAEVGVSWGATFAGVQNPSDVGGGDFTTGATFTDQAGVQTRWVLFRPDGIPVGFSNACVFGSIGSGGGGVYVTNGTRDYSAVLTPLGGVKLRGFDRATAAWQN
jgi:prepilin-type N-terminal cleavage/methylation domain-containing protein